MKKIQNQKIYKCVHTRGQKIRGWLALIMLFICGLMVGMGIKSNKNFSASDSGLNIDQCEWAERVLLSEMPDEKTYDVYAHELRLKIYQELESFCGEKYLPRVYFEKDIIRILYNVAQENNDFQQDKVQLDQLTFQLQQKEHKLQQQTAQLAQCESQIQEHAAQFAACEEQIQQHAAQLVACENLNKIGERDEDK